MATTLDKAAQAIRDGADSAATQAANDAAANANDAASRGNAAATEAATRADYAYQQGRAAEQATSNLNAAENAASTAPTTHGAVESRPTSDSFTNLAGQSVSASEGDTVYVYDEQRIVRYDPSDGDADANGWVGLTRYAPILSGTAIQRQDFEERWSEGPSEWSKWEPPTQPAYDGSGSELDLSTASSQDVVDELWEPLREDFSSTISRSVLGQGSGGKDIYLYDFAPPAWERKAIVFCNAHGGEVWSILGTYRFLYEAYHNYASNPHLSYARWKVRWLVVPIVNRAGLDASPRTRQNANGVDLNRNYDFDWLDYGSRKFGDSEVDTSSDEIILTDHGFSDGNQVVIHVGEGGSAPGGLSADTDYYVVNATTDRFQLAETEGGSAIGITDAGSGDRYVYGGRPGDYDYKGSEPFSEPESQIVRDLVEAHPDAILAYDMHSFTSGGSDDRKYLIYLPNQRLTSDSTSASEVVGALANPDDYDDGLVAFGHGTSPTCYNWVASQGIYSANPEWIPTTHGGAELDETDVTACTRWFGNLLLRGVRSEPPQARAFAAPRVLRFRDGSLDNMIPEGSEYQDLMQYEHIFYVKRSGIVVLNGTAVVGGPNEGNVFLTPKLGQDATGWLASASTESPSNWESYAQLPADSRVAIPFHAAISVVAGSHDTRPVRVGLFAKAGAADVRIYRYNCVVQYIPSDSGERMQNFFFSTNQDGFLKDWP